MNLHSYAAFAGVGNAERLEVTCCRPLVQISERQVEVGEASEEVTGNSNAEAAPALLWQSRF